MVSRQKERRGRTDGGAGVGGGVGGGGGGGEEMKEGEEGEIE